MTNNDNSCGFVGYAFVPVQTMGETYTPEESLENGTMFPELNIPMSEYGPSAD